MTELISLGDDQFGIAMLILIFARVSTIVALLPAIGTRSVPTRVKLMIGSAISIFIFGSVDIPDVKLTLQLVLSEALLGLIFGAFLRISAFVLQIVGTIIGQATSISQLLGGTDADPAPAFGQILLLGAYALLFLSHYHIHILNALLVLYETWPIGYALAAAMVAEWVSIQTTQMFALAFSLSAPFLVLSLLYNATLGVIGKAMPQLMVAFVGAPAITFLGVLVFSLSVSVILAIWSESYLKSLLDPLGG